MAGNEHDDEVGAALGAPGHFGDDVTTLRERQLEKERDEAVALANDAIEQSIHWRTVALDRWCDLMDEATLMTGRAAVEHRRLQEEVEALKATLSWRVTRPLRAMRERFPRDEDGG
jgi:hypothetical protein